MSTQTLNNTSPALNNTSPAIQAEVAAQKAQKAQKSSEKEPYNHFMTKAIKEAIIDGKLKEFKSTQTKTQYVAKLVLSSVVGALSLGAIGFLAGGPVGLVLGVFIGAGVGYGAGIIIEGKRYDAQETTFTDAQARVVSKPVLVSKPVS